MSSSKKTGEKEQTIADRLREARQLAGLSQAQAAHRLSLHRPAISEIEAGRRSVSADELKQFADVYAVRTSWLLGEAPDDTSSDKLLMAARELGKIRDEDLQRLVRVIQMLKTEK